MKGVNMIRKIQWVGVMCVAFAAGCGAMGQVDRPAGPEGGRTVMSLDGDWQIAEGPMNAAPAKYEHAIPVPGLIDMARPPFRDVGVRSPLRDAFWYRRTFNVQGPIPAVAVLTVHRAMFGARVILNGKVLGDHLPCFTPDAFDAHDALQVGQNELLIRVGAFQDALPRTVPNGWDYEKRKFIPGIFDSVELTLTGAPHIVRMQAVPDIDKKSVTVHAWVSHLAPGDGTSLRMIVREVSTGRVVGEAPCAIPAGSDPERTGLATVPLRNCRLWSPETPFLYEVEARGSADAMTARFGMRTFRFDPDTGRAMLNGKPYFMRGSNVTLYRFFEDAQRGDKPWREEWVRRMHRAFRDMHWNSLRYCIGFPPEAWYRIADEEGFLIQDEFPIWNMSSPPKDFDAGELAREFTEWMQERWNHPCVVLWDACNETKAVETGEAIRKVRGLDFSNRPWDNGWGAPQDRGDSSEQHPYHFCNPVTRLANIGGEPGTLGWKPGKNAIIVNEYGWLWLNRDGTPTTLTKQLYRNLLGRDSTTAQREQLYARHLAAETELWRSRRALAGVLHFCALGYSRPDGQTSDHWVDVEKLTWEPQFATYVRDSFAPVGIMLDAWAETYPMGKAQTFPVFVINDLYEDWRGTVRLRLSRDGKLVQEKIQPCVVAALGKEKLTFDIPIPNLPGDYQLEAALVRPGEQAIRSLRDFRILSEAQRLAPASLATGKPVTASSSIVDSGAKPPAAVVDGRLDTRWSSSFSDPQWIAVDLEKQERISRVTLYWEVAYAEAYSIDVSLDGKTWKQVYQTNSGQGESEVVRFAPVDARWVRITGTRRVTPYGYSLWEIGVFKE